MSEKKQNEVDIERDSRFADSRFNDERFNIEVRAFFKFYAVFPNYEYKSRRPGQS